MKRGFVPLALGCLVVLGFATACADTRVGTGFLDVADVRDPPMPDHFTGAPVPLQGRLALRSNGCVTVVVDSVERAPLWPEGTDVAQDPGNLERYVVTLPGGATLTVDEASGDTFSALGIVDTNPDPFEVEAGLLTKVGSVLAFCGVEALPVAFPDATTFTVG